MNVSSMLKYATVAAALLLVGTLAAIAVSTVNAQISQPIAQIGGGFSVAQPVAQGSIMGTSVVSTPFAGTSVTSAPFVSNTYMPGYQCYQQYPGGPFTCYPYSSGVYSSNVYQYPGGVIQPVRQVGFGTQVAAPVAVI
jgi:hypothetical protein